MRWLGLEAIEDQQQKVQSKSTGGGGRILGHVEEKTGKEEEKRKKRHQQQQHGCKPNTNERRRSKDVTLTVLQKNTRSLNSSERIEEMFSEVQGSKWDVILVSETWRSSKEEKWEPNQGHVVMGARKIEDKHSVAIILKKKWKHRTKNGPDTSANVPSQHRSLSTSSTSL